VVPTEHGSECLEVARHIAIPEQARVEALAQRVGRLSVQAAARPAAEKPKPTTAIQTIHRSRSLRGQRDSSAARPERADGAWAIEAPTQRYSHMISSGASLTVPSREKISPSETR
jgi:hypothetical protein